jgi:hypothetical protein
VILVNQDIIARFESRDPERFPNAKEVMLNSVEIWKSKLPDLDPKFIGVRRICSPFAGSNMTISWAT